MPEKPADETRNAETSRQRDEDDRRMERLIAVILQTGVGLAAAVVAVGGMVFLYRYGRLAPDYRVFRGEPSDLSRLSGIVQDAVTGHSRGIVQLGLLLLIATPVLRVAFSLVAFLKEGDRLYVIVTLVVLTLLLFSLFGALA